MGGLSARGRAGLGNVHFGHIIKNHLPDRAPALFVVVLAEFDYHGVRCLIRLLT